MDKKEIENKINELVTEYEKDTGLEVSYVDVHHCKGAGFHSSKSTDVTIKIKN